MELCSKVTKNIIIFKISLFLFCLGIMSCADMRTIKPDKEKTNIARVHERLHLIEFREALLPFGLRTGTNRKIGDTLLLDGISYKVVKIIPKYFEKRHGGTIVRGDESRIVLKSKDGKYTLRLQVGKPVYSPRPKAVIKDIETNKKYHVGIGDIIEIYLKPKAGFSKSSKRRRRKTIKYKVIEIDKKKKQLVVEYKGKKYIIKH